MKNQNYGENTAGAYTKQAEKMLQEPKNIGMADKKTADRIEIPNELPAKSTKIIPTKREKDSQKQKTKSNKTEISSRQK